MQAAPRFDGPVLMLLVIVQDNGVAGSNADALRRIGQSVIIGTNDADALLPGSFALVMSTCPSIPF